MGRINWARVLLGGIAAGIVINVSEAILNTVIIGERFAARMRELNLDPEGGSLAVWILYGFVLGILAVWLYAAIRPRFGAGPRTALIAGFAVWLITSFLGNVAMLNMGLFPADMTVIGMAVGLVEVLLGTLLGASIYKEDEA